MSTDASADVYRRGSSRRSSVRDEDEDPEESGLEEREGKRGRIERREDTRGMEVD